MENPFKLIRYYPLTSISITILIIIEYICLNGIFNEYSFGFDPTFNGLKVLWKYFNIPISIALSSL